MYYIYDIEKVFYTKIKLDWILYRDVQLKFTSSNALELKIRSSSPILT